MDKLPKLSGWPDEMPYPDPKNKAYMALEDLKELKENPRLISSPSWLSLFAKNAFEFEKEMTHLRDHPSAKKFLEIQNWFENAREEEDSLSEILSDLHRSHFQKIQPLQNFLEKLLKKDPEGMNLLIKLFENYVKNA